MPNNPNSDRELLTKARELCASRNNPAHRRAIERGDWDGYGQMNNAERDVLAQLVAEPVIDGGDE